MHVQDEILAREFALTGIGDELKCIAYPQRACLQHLHTRFQACIWELLICQSQACTADELPDDRFRSHGVLEPESQAREYRMAAGGAAATSAGLAFNVVAAMASDAGQAVARRMQSLDFRGDEAARER